MGAAPLGPGTACAQDPAFQKPDVSGGSIFDVYEIGGILGSGSFGQVRSCWPRGEPEEKRRFAVKVVDTKSTVYKHAASFISARQEASVLQSVHHPHIVELIDVFEKERWLFMVMECVQGGELFSALADPQVAVNEGCVATVGRQLLEALRHLHDRSIVHRDVKAENILLLTNPAKTSSWHIKLIDFGLAMRVEQPPACLFRMCREQEVPIEELICGTAYYCAPEVWVNDYGPRVDVWAAGVVLYLALYGSFPYYDGDANALEALICDPDAEPTFVPVCAKECPGYQVSPQARQCLVALLEKDEESRPTAAAALQQPWLQETKRSGSVAMLPRPRPPGMKAARSSSAGCVAKGGDQFVPVAVRVKAGRAAARPPVDSEKEQSRTDALEALKARAARGAGLDDCKGSSFLWRTPSVTFRQLEAEPEPEADSRPDSVEAVSSSLPMLSWMEHDVAPADSSLTDSDTDEGHALCACR